MVAWCATLPSPVIDRIEMAGVSCRISKDRSGAGADTGRHRTGLPEMPLAMAYSAAGRGGVQVESLVAIVQASRKMQVSMISSTFADGHSATIWANTLG